jgi:hypothetical protein
MLCDDPVAVLPWWGQWLARQKRIGFCIQPNLPRLRRAIIDQRAAAAATNTHLKNLPHGAAKSRSAQFRR